MSDPAIPFGYKRITGQLQKGDGVWNGTRFAKARKQYPFAGDAGIVAIRRCEVEQAELPEVCSVCGGHEPCSHDFDKENRQLEEIGRIMGTGLTSGATGVPEMEVE